MTDTAEIFVDCKCDLAEGPFWHPKRNELFWFDINKGRLFHADAKANVLDRIAFDEPVSAAALIDYDTLMIATASGLQRLDIASGAREPVIALEADNPDTRTNDSRVAPDGSWWIGTMGTTEVANAGTLYRYFEGEFTTLLPRQSIPNATCFSPDGRIAYFADSPTRQIRKVALNAETGLPDGPWEVFVDLTGQSAVPDGAVTDTEGFVWNAEYGGSRVVRYAPDGTVDRVVELPCPNITCPAFGGEDLKTLFITTAAQGMSEQQLAEYPLSGGIFRFDVDAPGLAETKLKI